MKTALFTLVLVLPTTLLSGTPHAYARAGSGHEQLVTLTGTALGESHYASCAPITVFLANKFPHDQNVLVDIELRNASSTLIEQEAFDNLSVVSTKKSGQDTFLTNHCSMNLTAGTYTYSVGLFTPGWGELVHWYSNVASFTAQPFATQSIQYVRIDRPKTNLPDGASASITPTLINTGETQTGLTVTVSLWRGGNFIDEVTYTSQTLAQNTEESFPFHTIPLMAGSYTIRTQVTDASGTIIANFPDLGTIAVE